MSLRPEHESCSQRARFAAREAAAGVAVDGWQTLRERRAVWDGADA